MLSAGCPSSKNEHSSTASGCLRTFSSVRTPPVVDTCARLPGEFDVHPPSQVTRFLRHGFRRNEPHRLHIGHVPQEICQAFRSLLPDHPRSWHTFIWRKSCPRGYRPRRPPSLFGDTDSKCSQQSHFLVSERIPHRKRHQRFDLIGLDFHTL